MSTIELIDVKKAWGSTVAVRDVSFTAAEGQFLVLLGPSGCGKSTTLRMIAGLETLTAGCVRIADRDVTTLAPADRRISMVFQSYALFPHLSVEENIVFGLKVRNVSAADRQNRLANVAEIVGLADLLNRRPAQLSGGQRQRVALARAIIAENKICLMDEPLSNLDAKLRHEMRVEIRALQRRLDMTVVYVTHDQTEAMSMADRVILMREGRVEQEGSPDELYRAPATTFAAGFIGTPPMNLLTLSDGPHGAVVEGAEDHPLVKRPGMGYALGIRAEDISISPDGVPAHLLSTDYLGADTIVTAQVGQQSLLVRLPGHVSINEGEPSGLSWPPEAAHIFDTTTGKRLET